MDRTFFKAIIPLLLLVFVVQVANGQEEEPIRLTNPSFEDMPRHSQAPIGWKDCGFPSESPPDIQPDPLGQFQVSKAAYHGGTYLGMVVRDNDTWERVSQQLSSPMKSGTCYEFKMHLARSEMYVSQTRTTGSEQNYVTPAKLRIYGGFAKCDRAELLAESALVINYRWIEYQFRFEPKGDYDFIVFEAFYNTPTLFPYNGNVLLDNASPIVAVPCDETPTDAVAEVPTPYVDQTPRSDPEPPTNSGPTTTDPVPENTPDAILAGIPYSEMFEGQIIQVEGIRFDANSYAFQESSNPHLEELYDFMQRHKDIMVEVGGHTNSFAGDDFAEELSTKRALSVANYLTKNGIDSRRIKVKGYGKSRQIASNKTKEGQRINQRVEIKILDKT